MSQPIEREYIPLALRQAMKATRLANAREAAHGYSTFRYIITNPVHEAVITENIRVMDSVAGEVITVPELLQRLPEDLRKLVLHS